jgi:chromosome segregation ATPase
LKVNHDGKYFTIVFFNEFLKQAKAYKNKAETAVSRLKDSQLKLGTKTTECMEFQKRIHSVERNEKDSIKNFETLEIENARLQGELEVKTSSLQNLEQEIVAHEEKLNTKQEKIIEFERMLEEQVILFFLQWVIGP